MKITSPAFSEGEKIPSKYTCDGSDISPPLKFDEVPDNCQSLCLICDDPDAPMGTWVHWVVFNLPPEVNELPEETKSKDVTSMGGLEGKTNFGRPGYGGPCPPGGTHRYFFKLYALSEKLSLPAGSTKEDLLAAMEGKIIEESHLMGRYSR